MFLNLLKKEFTLALHPTSVVFVFFAAFVFIPNYPYEVMCFFSCLSIYFMCLSGRENKDIFFTCMLPVQKGQIAFARIVTAVILQTALLLLSAVLIVLKAFLLPEMINQAGLDANFALVGWGFILFAVFNICYFPMYFKEPNKIGKPFLISSAILFLFIAAVVTASYTVPFIRNYIDKPGFAYLSYQIVVLLVGIIVYTLVTALATHLSVRRFEKVDI